MAKTIESEEFYELMQAYRHTPVATQMKVVNNYQAVIDYIDKDRAERDRRIVAATVEACKKICDNAALHNLYGVGDGFKSPEDCAESIRAITPESVLADIDKKQETAA